MTKLLLLLVVAAQRLIVVISYAWFRVATPKAQRGSIDWIVGPDELASVVYQIRNAVPGTYAVSFPTESAYNFAYDYAPRSIRNKRLRAWRRLLIGPVVFARLANRARGFLYVGATGFLANGYDHRNFELGFLKRRGLKVALYWTGSEIRSTRKMHELEATMGLPNISTYIGQISPFFETEEHERVQQRRAAVSMKYADVMFDYPTDQKSYLTGYREPGFFLMAPERFVETAEKFANLSKIVVTHATTSPVIKGTPLVRAAISQLREEGYDFEYVELIGVTNSTLIEVLSRTHIALNQFYGFTLTVFGLEAMSAGCALLASTDGSIETNLPPHVNDSIVVTKHWEVYENLKALLDDPSLIEPIAWRGREWARKYQSRDTAGALMKAILDSVLDDSYDREVRSRLSNEDVYSLHSD